MSLQVAEVRDLEQNCIPTQVEGQSKQKVVWFLILAKIKLKHVTFMKHVVFFNIFAETYVDQTANQIPEAGFINVELLACEVQAS